ncbi:MAG: GNAT family N-acetyltransferase [Acidimicrobiales bacterium]
MTLVHVDPVKDPRWAALVEPPSGTLFHSPSWLGAIADTYGYHIRAAVLTSDTDGAGRAHPSDVQAGLAYVVLDDDLGRRAALPFADAAGPLVDMTAGFEEDWSELAAAMAGSQAVPSTLRCLRIGGSAPVELGSALVEADVGWTATKRARWHRLDLRESSEAAWAAAAGPFRQGVRKAERAGVEVRPLAEVEADGGVAAFAGLHRNLRRTKYGMLSQPEAFFANIRDRFAPLEAWHPLGAYVDDVLVAATVYLRWGDVLYYKFNASDPGALEARPNNLLLWAGSEVARSLGCSALDLGPSDDDQPGLIRFKAQSGATEGEVTTWTWTAPGSAPDPSAGRLKETLGELTALLIQPEVDEAVVEAAGDALYRWFA